MASAVYDAAGNRTSLLELDGTRVTYAFDPTYQLVNEQRSGANAYNTTYQYDPVGNRLLKNDSSQLTTYSFNVASQLTLITPPSGQPTTQTWDAAGNLSVANSGGSLMTHTWDSENRLTLIVAGDASRATYVYSGDGKRQQAVASPPVNFIWDGENLLMETDNGGVTQAQYTEYPAYWGGLKSQRRSGASSFHCFDLQANTRLLVSSAGSITDRYDYKAFGEDLAESGSTTNFHKCAGQVGYYSDNPTRCYVRARHLCPEQARWLSRDPLGIGAPGGNPYLYALNSPVGLLDASGLLAAGFGRYGEPPNLPRNQWNPYWNCDAKCEFAPRRPLKPVCPRNAQEEAALLQLCKTDREIIQSGVYRLPFLVATTERCCLIWPNYPAGSPTTAQALTGCTQFLGPFYELPGVYQKCIALHEHRRRRNCQWYGTPRFVEGSYYGGELEDFARVLQCVKLALSGCKNIKDRSLFSVCDPRRTINVHPYRAGGAAVPLDPSTAAIEEEF